MAITTLVATILPPGPTADAQDPDGERIVFVWRETEPRLGSEFRLQSVRPDGSDIRTIMDDQAGSDPDVSPDGTTIVFVFDGDLWLVDRDGGNRRRITNAAADGRRYSEPRFSPDGTELAYRVEGQGVYVSPVGRPSDERLVAANGSDPNDRGMFPDNPRWDDDDAGDGGVEWFFGSPSWSPDGSRLVMSRSYEGPGYPGEVWSEAVSIVNSDGSDLHDVPNTRRVIDRISDTVWSPDGTSIAYLENPSGAGDDIVITAADGSTRRTILKYDAWSEGLAWSPDGSELVYTSFTHVEGNLDGPPTDLLAIRPDGTGKRLVLEKRGAESTPTFAPPQAGGTATARSTEQACPEGEVPDSGFTDIGTSEHRAAIDCAAWWGVTTGRAGTTYAPSERVTRAQMASFIARAITGSGGELPTPSKDHFSDDDGSVHEPSINALAEAGVVAGVGDGRYEPSRPVARDQMARFLAQALEFRTGELLPASADYFADDAGDTHESAINKTAEAGVTAGNGSGYAPTEAVSRAQMASFLTRLLDVLVEQGLTAPPPTG